MFALGTSVCTTFIRNSAQNVLHDFEPELQRVISYFRVVLR